MIVVRQAFLEKQLASHRLQLAIGHCPEELRHERNLAGRRIEARAVVADRDFAELVYRDRALVIIITRFADIAFVEDRKGVRIENGVADARLIPPVGSVVDRVHHVDAAIMLIDAAADPFVERVDDALIGSDRHARLVPRRRRSERGLAEIVHRPQGCAGFVGRTQIVDLEAERVEIEQRSGQDRARRSDAGAVHALQRETAVLERAREVSCELLHSRYRRCSRPEQAVERNDVQSRSPETVGSSRRRASEVVGADIDGIAVQRERRIVGGGAEAQACIALELDRLPTAQCVIGVGNRDLEILGIGTERDGNPAARRCIVHHAGVAIGARLAGSRPESHV